MSGRTLGWILFGVWIIGYLTCWALFSRALYREDDDVWDGPGDAMLMVLLGFCAAWLWFPGVLIYPFVIRKRREPPMKVRDDA